MKRRLWVSEGWLEDYQFNIINKTESCLKCTKPLSRSFLMLDIEIFFEKNSNYSFKVGGDCIIMEFIYKCSNEEAIGVKTSNNLTNTHNVLYSPAYHRKFRLPEGDIADMMTIILSKNLYFKLIPKNSNLHSEFSNKIRKGEACCLFDTHIAFTPSIQAVLKDIEKCSYEGELKRLYLENKIQELLLLHLELYQHYNLNPKGSTMDKEDLEKLMEAKKILDDNFINAPTLKELSRMTYLNEFKLKNEFKAHFGTSVKQYIIGLRMKYALELIKEGELSITEIAHLSGYNGLVQFSTAFKRYYGVPPTRI